MNHRLNHRQWREVNNLALEIHRATERQELINIVVKEFPAILELNYTVWHKRLKTAGLSAERIEADSTYRDALASRMPTLDHVIQHHPVIVGLEMGAEINLPLDKVVSMYDFVSARELQNNPVYREVYRHAAIMDHASVEFWHDNDEGAMICFNAPKPFTMDQKFMIHVLRQHLSITYKRLAEAESQKGNLAQALPRLDSSTLTRRERETLPHLLNGKSNPEIATILGISPRTAEKHVASIIEKSGAENRKTLIAESAFRMG